MDNLIKLFFKIFCKVAVCRLFALLLLSMPALAIDDYEYIKVYSAAGKLLGEYGPADGEGRHQATRYTYYSSMPSLVQTIESGNLSYEPSANEDPANWSGFTFPNTKYFVYDDFGRKKFESHYSSSEIVLKQFGYDDRNRLKCETVRMGDNRAPAVYWYTDACSHGAEGSYGPDRITRYNYDDIDNILVIEKGVGTPLEQQYATYTYDGKQKTSATDANGNYSKYTYDELGRLEYFYYPDKTNTGAHNTSDYEKYGYDNNSNRTMWRRRSGDEHTFYYEFDALNRMERKNVPNTNSKDVYYEYELNGVMTEALFGSHNGSGVTHKPNGFGEVVSTVTNKYGNRELRYSYDQHGNRTYVYHPDNKYARYFYDKLDRPYRLQIHGSTFAWYNYDELGRVESIDRNVSRNGAPTIIGYDGLGRVASIEHDFDNTASDFNNSFTYSPASQLTSIHYANDQYQYIGNDKLTGSYAVNGLNQYTSVAGNSVSYDTKGNLYVHDGATYTYDDENRLTKVARSGQSSFYLYYDPLGRLERTYISGGANRYFLWDGDALVAEYTSTSSNAPAMRYAHGVGTDVPILQLEGSSTSSSARRAIHADQRGSVVAYSDYNGNETNINSYDEYGIPGFENMGRFGFTGQLWLPEVGLYHYKARVYHPKLGRFLQTDPVGYEDQTNLYAYVGNDPMNNTDPSGEVIQALIPLAVAACAVNKCAQQFTDSVGAVTEMLAWDGKSGSANKRSKAKRRAARKAQRKKSNPKVAVSQSGKNVQGKANKDNLRGQIKTGMDGKTKVGVQDGSKDSNNNDTDHKPAVDVGNMKGGDHPDLNTNGGPNIRNGKVKEDI